MYKSDIEIAQESEMNPVTQIAHKINLTDDEIELFGKYKAKLTLETTNHLSSIPKTKLGKLVLVTSINPTPAGEGKSTVSIGLADALNRLNKNAVLALREPSLGPVMGIKGGATGGGYAQVLPMEDINLHFTGDIHALTSANNTLAALIDNHIKQGNELNIDPRTITWKRSLDINDRQLRNIIDGLGGVANGVPREDSFQITVASELMAILCLSLDLDDFKERVNKILIGYTYDKKPVFVKDLGVAGSITALFKDAINPNLVQTIEHTPAFIHGGPFANIAHGCNSILATKSAMATGDIAVTEAGFGADLGAEKFLDIKTPNLPKAPDAIVIVATIRSLKYNGGTDLKHLTDENITALTKGFSNLKQHINNLKQYGIPLVVAINKFVSDTDDEINKLQSLISDEGVPSSITDVWGEGGAGGIDLANNVLAAFEKPSNYLRLYENSESLKQKISTIATKIYHAANVEFSDAAKKQLATIENNGWDQLPVCIAKTQYSFSDNPNLLGAPQGFTLHVQNIRPNLGAGFIVVETGSILTMPGLPKHPAALDIDIDNEGKISGLF